MESFPSAIPNASPDLGVWSAILQAARPTLMVGLGASRLESAADDSSIKSSSSTRKRDNAVPVMTVIQAAVTGLGMAPGLEAAVGAALKVLTMYEVRSCVFLGQSFVLR